jgi:hypothetical protein
MAAPRRGGEFVFSRPSGRIARTEMGFADFGTSG